MSLNWNAKSVQYFKDNPDELWVEHKTDGGTYHDVNAETKSLIFGAMVVGLGSITEDNVIDWYARWKVLEKLENYYLYYRITDNDYEYVYISVPILEKHINLSMNVSNETEAKWAKRMASNKFADGVTYTAKEISALITVNKMEYKKIIKNQMKEALV